MTGEPRRDPFRGIDMTQYPDLETGQGLVNVLQRAAEAAGIDVGTIGTRSKAEFAGYTSARIETPRGVIAVNIAVRERRFLVDITQDALHVASGGTTAVAEILELSQLWASGASYEALNARFPDLQVSGLARVLASPDTVAAQWEWLRSAPEFSDELPLLDAVYADNVLRSYFPDLSHRSIELCRSFSDRTDSVSITVLGAGRFRVRACGKDRFEDDYASVEEAVEAARGLLDRHDG
ncbi:DUF6193 family natural product biosynthesis protein [Streptomyces virginiae]|uniref:DUF6193 family natural product biosynthesis protein n=1 Tax=Streptomyces virginiae TaxID=1961 RepID=UPI00366318B2